MIDPPGDFARQLRSLREAQGLSVRALADLVGVSSVTIWKWEKGDSKPRARLLPSLAQALDVPAGRLKAPSGNKRTAANSLNAGLPGKPPLGPAEPAESAPAEDDETGAAPPEPLADVIARAKQMIADASGTGTKNITILIEY